MFLILYNRPNIYNTKKNKRKNDSSTNKKDNPVISPYTTSIPNINNLLYKTYDEELDNGNKEYKLKLIGITSDKLEKRITQMKFRLQEGNGECYYFLGVEDNGNPLGISEEELKESIGVIQIMVNKIKAEILKIEYFKGKQGTIAEITIKKEEHIISYNRLEIKVGLIGEEDSGKSTMIGCLITNKKDNGKGLTRTNVFRHRHEITCGKTSSFTHQILGFNKDGNKVNINQFGSKAPWSEIVKKSTKIINFIDMGGYSKFYYNSLKPLSSNYLDYIFLLISAINGITNYTEFFLKIAIEMKLPLVIIITKTDLINNNDISIILNNLKKVLNSIKCKKKPLLVKSKEDVVSFANNMNEAIIPLFLVSNTTGIGLDYISNFLSVLPLIKDIDISDEDIYSKSTNLEFHFLEIIKNSTDNKIIIEGIITEGELINNQIYKLGPIDFNSYKDIKWHRFRNELININKTFIEVKVITIHCKKMNVNMTSNGQFCSVEVQILDNNISDYIIKYNILRTGLVLLGYNKEEICTKRIKVELWSQNNHNDIILKSTYQPLLHIEHISQCAKFITNDEYITIKPYQSIEVEMEFLYYPEYIKLNTFVIILDNNVHLYGNVVANKYI